MITVYEIPVEDYEAVYRNQENPPLYRIVAEGTWEEVTRELVGNLNHDTIDTVNCYLYIKETGISDKEREESDDMEMLDWLEDKGMLTVSAEHAYKKWTE